ncbi:hypothetical protein U4Y67_20185 [Escherichia coli]|nr:hypothetical protein [Escherichia coli]
MKGIIYGATFMAVLFTLTGCDGDKYKPSPEHCNQDYWKTLPEGADRDSLVEACMKGQGAK